MTEPKVTSLSAEATEELPGARGLRIPLVGLSDGAQLVDVHVNILNADSGRGPRHLHEESENVYVVLEGKVDVGVGDRTYTAGPGDVVFIPRGCPHYAGATGGAAAKVLELYAPPINRDGSRDFKVLDESG